VRVLAAPTGNAWGRDSDAKEVTTMTTATQAGQAGLQGWRGKVADGVAEPVAKRTPLDEDQVRALIGAAFFVLSVIYIVNAARELVKSTRS
jgi:hypothetical protein